MRNWTIREAVETICEGTDVAGMKEIASFNPVFFKAVCTNDVAAVAAMMGEKFTLRRLLKEVPAETEVDNTDVDMDTDDDVEEATPSKKSTKNATKSAEADGDLNKMSTKQLIVLCNDRGIEVPKYGKNKAFYLDALVGAGTTDDDGETETADATDVEAEIENPYAGKNAMSLYKLCKDRGIKCEARQKSKVYLELLAEADAAEAESDDDTIDDSWGEDAEEVIDEAPAKRTKSTKGAKAKGAAKEVKKAAAIDDDEDWDI